MKVLRKIFPALLLLALFVCFLVPVRVDADDISLGVMGFDGPVSEGQARGIAGLFARELSGVGFSVVSGEEIEYDRSTDPIETAAEYGRNAGLRYVLLGSIRELGRPSDIEALSLRLSQGARATIDLRVIDVETAHTRALLSETGSSSNVAPSGEPEPDDFDGFDELEARAILDAVSRLGRSTAAAFGRGRPFVISSSRKEYSISPGDFNSPIIAPKTGAFYLVHALGLMRDADGGIAGKKIPLAVLNVKRVESERWVAVVSSPAKPASILPGDVAELISRESVRSLTFADVRPSDISDSARPNQDESPEAEDASSVADADETGPSDPGDAADKGAPDAFPDLSAQNSQDPADPKTSHGRNRDDLLDILSSVGEPGAESGMPHTSAEPQAPSQDPNQSTDVAVIDTYPIYHVERDGIAKRHLSALNLYRQGKFAEAYAEFSGVADVYSGNYLSAYWAGRAALELKNSKAALTWFNRTLSINPEYQPAIEAKRGIM
ncbi:MAG: hypothetical protein LBS93_04495 [Synergistaceae bacterium]|jgi:TolA-binding protein|nr:hypothetical protein [Synergistaceae bacterium]